MRKKIFNLSASALLVCSLATSAVAGPRQAAPVNQSGMTLKGKVSSKGGRFFVDDAATKKTVEVQGENLQKWVGKLVRVAGEVTVGTVAAPQVLVVTEVTQVAGAALAGGAAAAAGVKAGISTAAIATVGAGATAATVGTLYATDVIGGEETPASNQ